MQDIQKKYNTSSLIITHDVDCARVISDRMLLLIDGIDYAVGTFEELSTSEDPKIKAFLNTNVSLFQGNEKTKAMKKIKFTKTTIRPLCSYRNCSFYCWCLSHWSRREYVQKDIYNKFLLSDVNGLQKGNNVRYSGIDIGTVKDITMVNDSTIKVELSIEEKIISHIKKNAIATIGSDGLVGNMIVNIVPGKGISEVIENNTTIESYSKIGTDDILNTLNTSTENAAILTSDLLNITNSITKGKGTIGVLLNDTIMAQDLKQSVANLKYASRGASNSIAELNTIISSIKTDDQTVLGMLLNDTISGEKLKHIVTNLEASSVEIESVLKNINSVVDDFNSSEGTYNYVVKDTSLVNSLKSTLKNINEGTDKFNQNMEALKHNFLTRGYFRKLERQEKKEAKNN